MVLKAKHIFCVLLGLTAVLASCSRKRQPPSWDADILLPIANVSLTLEKLIPDSLKKIDPNGKISIAYHQLLIDTPASSLAKIPDTSLVQSLRLQDMTLANTTVSHVISLGRICEQGGVTGATIIANHGSSLAVPSLSSSSPNKTSIDASSLFQSAQIVSGTMEFSVTNNFPIDITNFVFSLTNKSDNSMIVQDTFKLIKADGGKETHSLPLNGKKIEGALDGTILNIASPGSGSNSVIIDTGLNSLVQISLKNIQVSSVTAVFPSRTLIDFNKDFNFSANGAEIQYLRLDKGLISLEATSTLPENLKLVLELPGAKKAGIVYSNNFAIAKSIGGNPVVSKVNFDLSGHIIDLRGGLANGSNTIKAHVLASVDSTGIASTITNTDSLQLKFTLNSIEPEWVQGYFGMQSTKLGPSNINTKVFEKIVSGTFQLDKLELSLNVENGIGVNSQIDIKKLAAVSPTQTLDLAGSSLSGPLIIGRALDNPYRQVGSFFRIDETNSNIMKLVENKPTQLQYEVDLKINAQGNVHNYRDFFYKDSRIKLRLGVEMPFAFYADQLTIVDTVAISIGSLNKDGKLNSITLKLLAENGFPLEATANVVLLDASKNKLDELFLTGGNLLRAGTLSPGNAAVCFPVKSSIQEFVTADRITTLEKAKYAAIVINLQTRPGGILRFYDYWKMNVKLIADANYRVGGK